MRRVQRCWGRSLTGRLAAKFSWTISETIKLSEHITAFPSLEDSQVQIRNSLAPSTRAASMSSCDIVKKNCLNRKMKNGVPRKAGTTSGA